MGECAVNLAARYVAGRPLPVYDAAPLSVHDMRRRTRCFVSRCKDGVSGDLNLSLVLAAMESSGAIKMVGAMYNLHTGVVDFLE